MFIVKQDFKHVAENGQLKKAAGIWAKNFQEQGA